MFLNDENEFIKALEPLENVDDELRISVRGVYLIEGQIDLLLKILLKNIQDMDAFKRLGLIPKLDLCISLGAITHAKHTRAIIKKINNVRNICAHDPYYKLTTKDAEEIKNTFFSNKENLPQEYLEIVFNEYQISEPITALRCAITGALMMIERNIFYQIRVKAHKRIYDERIQKICDKVIESFGGLNAIYSNTSNLKNEDERKISEYTNDYISNFLNTRK